MREHWEMQTRLALPGAPYVLQYSTHLGELVPRQAPTPALGHEDKGTCPLPQVPPGCSLEAQQDGYVTAWTGVDVREVRPVSEGVYACAGVCIHVQWHTCE